MYLDKPFLRHFFVLALPIAAQQLISSGLNALDGIMIGSLGETAIAGVGLANQIYFILSLMLFGISSGGTVFIAQFWGKRDLKSIQNTLGISVTFAAALAFVATAVALCFPRQLIRLFSPDEAVIQVGTQYLRVAAISYIPNAISLTVGAGIRSTEKPKIPLYMSIFSLVCNGCLNAVFIFGLLGVPAMGAVGAAWGTVISRVAECGILLFILYRFYRPIAPGARDFVKPQKGFLPRYVKTSMPVFFNETLWGTGVALYSVIFARMSTDVVAAVNIARVLEQLTSVFFFGASYAVSIMIGIKIGQGRSDEAFDYAKKFNLLAVIVGLVFALLQAGVAPLFLRLYDVTPAVKTDALVIMLIIAAVMPFKSLSMTNIVGVLRSGGDTRFGLFLDVGAVWCLALPLGIIFGLVLRCNIYLVYALMMCEELIKNLLVLPRIFRGKWIHNLVQ